MGLPTGLPGKLVCRPTVTTDSSIDTNREVSGTSGLAAVLGKDTIWLRDVEGQRS